MAAQQDAADTLIGEILADRYQILERLGEGAMGTVYKARHIKVGRWFAVKVLHARLLADAKTAVRFEREAALAGRLRHANVVGVVDVGEVDGRHYMVMDFAEGPDLAQLLDEAPMRPARIIHLTRQILEGLYHAHEQGLIHRDLKPENVIIERDNHGDEMPRIVDFGIAILRDGGDSTDGEGRLTTNGLVLGTPHYMAPEQAVADPIDHRIDLFALGIVVYEMLSGHLPFDGSGAEVARANLLLEPPPISQRVPYLEVDPLLEAFARRLMAKKPSARPATAKAARELLDLIERDRDAAAVALRVPTTARVPATTEPVSPQQAGPGRQSPELPTTALPTTELATVAMLTRQLKATPSPNQPVPTYAASPAAGAPPSPPPSAARSARRDREATWAPHRARNRALIAALSLGAAGVIAAFVLTLSGDDSADTTLTARTDLATAGSSARPPAPAVPARAADTAPVTPPTSATADTAPLTPPTSAAADAAALAPAVVAATTAPPDLVKPARARPAGGKPTTKRPRTNDRGTHETNAAGTAIDPRTHELRTAGVNPIDPGPAKTEPKAGAPKVDDAASKGSGPKPTDPTMTIAPPTTGITASALSSLYYAVPKALDQLPADKAQDLRDRFRNFNVQALMLAPQAARDAGAAQLYQILREAKLRR